MASSGQQRDVSGRLRRHPVLSVDHAPPGVPFSWNGHPMQARAGEAISSALTASGVLVYGRHPKDGAPLGLFCANGQCASCTVVADGVAVKACMTPVRQGMDVHACDAAPELPADGGLDVGPTLVRRVDVLIVGAGPAGLAAAKELGAFGIDVLVVDDKAAPGGKLVLQTHKFFGSVADTSAGKRGVDIAAALAAAVEEAPTAELWLDATAVGAFADGRIGVVRHGGYWLIRPTILLVATGARERQPAFPGHTLPGVYGAGAFQTLLNRDQVVPGRRLLVVGGGNVGLIAAYHALQADMEVVAVVERLPAVGGYQVHADKLRRLGVPVMVRSTVLSVGGDDRVTSVTIAALDADGEPEPGSERTYSVDMVLIAVGLAPLDELARAAAGMGLRIYRAGDAAAVAEASAATFSGRIVARDIARELGSDAPPVPDEWKEKLAALAAGAGPVHDAAAPLPNALYPVLRCTEEIPCNPCATVCTKGAIELARDPLRGVPVYRGSDCTGCAKCVAVCPGLAITLVDAREDADRPVVTVPFELDDGHVTPGSMVLATDRKGESLGRHEVVAVKRRRWQDRTALVKIRASATTAPLIAGIQVQDPAVVAPNGFASTEAPGDDVVVCRCERVTAGEVRTAIRAGVRDVNELKAMLRVCMGACGGRNCPDQIARLFHEEGVADVEVTPPTLRPPFVEVPLGVFAHGSRRA